MLFYENDYYFVKAIDGAGISPVKEWLLMAKYTSILMSIFLALISCLTRLFLGQVLCMSWIYFKSFIFAKYLNLL
jgi:hypothetical protein